MILLQIGPQKLAADICMELSEKMKVPANELQLEELVLNHSLRRPVHYSEKVLDVVLRWGYWDEADRKDNCLVLTSMEKYKPFDDAEEPSAVLSEEFRFADNKTRTFKSFTFKFSQMKLSYYKDKSVRYIAYFLFNAIVLINFFLRMSSLHNNCLILF